MTQEDALRLAIIGLELWNAHLIGTHAESHRMRMHRMKHPEPGDIVIELSTSAWWRRGERIPGWDESRDCAFGTLVRMCREPYPLAPGEDLNDPDTLLKPRDERVFYISTLTDGREIRWTNADFVTILPVDGWPGI